MSISNSQAVWYMAMHKVFPANMRRRISTKTRKFKGRSAHPERVPVDELYPEIAAKKAQAISQMAQHWKDGILTTKNFLIVVDDIINSEG